MPFNIKHLEQSLKQIKPVAREFASFCRTLSTDYSAAKLLFAYIDVRRQQERLFYSFILVIKNLRQMGQLESVLRGLGTDVEGVRLTRPMT